MKKVKKERDIKEYKLSEAIKRVKAESKTKFDASIELHINLNIDPVKQGIRFSVDLPHGTGKTKKIAVLSSGKVNGADVTLDESSLSGIDSGKIKPNVDFEVFIAEPKFMPLLAKYAKVLGPAGVMPNPKNGTVTEDVNTAVEQFKKGKVEIKTEKLASLIHTIVGKVSFEDKALEENFKEIVNTLKQNKPAKVDPLWIKSMYLTSSMGPSVKVAIED
ncbi:50S ribosomal protein L1 [candidate division WWE3 bacterium]|uniref:Ribosomal protein n=1 Tax=candidate division WWE3 bacterium TaxID=2053526 RepID=A0A7X9E7H7_UNCKA|nr:50S ribosomal protein L1 [candidate division WWE3 bacterium]